MYMNHVCLFDVVDQQGWAYKWFVY